MENMILVEYSPDKVEVHSDYIEGDKFRRMLINDGKGMTKTELFTCKKEKL